MKIGVLGSGDVAKALAVGFLGRGDEVFLGTRDPQKLAEWQAGHGSAQVGSFADSAAFGELLVFCVNGDAVASAVDAAGAERFAGKVVIDTTNPVKFDERGPYLDVNGNDSLGERVQRAMPDAKVVKAFNIVGADLMVKPQLPGGPPSMFIAGNDDGAKSTVRSILTDFAWETIDLGGIESSRYLEAMCVAWVIYDMRNDSRGHAFRLLH